MKKSKKIIENERDFKMTRAELIGKIAESTGHTKKDVDIILKGFQAAVKDAVAEGDKITLTGFIGFQKKHVPAKSGVSKVSGTNKEWSTPEKDVIAVKLAKPFKEL